jgi:hypothetical protein
MERDPDAGEEMVHDLFLGATLGGDVDDSPLLQQARENVSEQAIDNLEQDRARAELHGRPRAKEVDGIVFATGPEPEAEKK